MRNLCERLFLLPFLALLLPLAAPMAAAQGDAERPNIVFILTDDQRWDMMGVKTPYLHTPEMDKLAREGVLFDNAFVTTSICAASRASIISGTWERTHGFTFRTPPLRPRFTDNSYPALLRKAGYRTGFAGKFGMGVEPGAREAMFDYFKPLNRNPYFKKQPDGSERHLTDITGDKAIEFLEGVEAGQPFCLSISFNAPHAEDSDPRQYIWPEAMDDLYTDLEVPLPETANPAFFASLPKFHRKSLNRIRWHWRWEPEIFQEKAKGYFRMISGVDAVIGRVRAQLEEQGLADNTIIIFTGDNGYFINERGFAGKWCPYEVSLRVPLVILDPRKGEGDRGRVVTNTALNVDIAPTILDLAGLPVPELMQGVPLTASLEGGEHPRRESFFVEHLFDHADIPQVEGVRTDQWKYMRYFTQDPVHEELYDLENDPQERYNLAANEELAPVLEELRRQTDAFARRYAEAGQ